LVSATGRSKNKARPENLSRLPFPQYDKKKGSLYPIEDSLRLKDAFALRPDIRTVSGLIHNEFCDTPEE
jgi:hypothetical protein